MQEIQPTIFDETYAAPIKRKSLLPWWIKLICYFFLLKGAIALTVIILAVFGYKQMPFLGLKTPDPFDFRNIPSAWPLVLIGIFAYGLLAAKKWAVNAALVGVILISVFNLYGTYKRIPYFLNDEYEMANMLSFTFQLLVGILFLWKLLKIRRKWAEAS